MKKQFKFEEQKSFAKLSEDLNPIHLNKEWAEKEYPGEIVVYGISLLLWGIESCSHEYQILRIKGRFIHPVFIGDLLFLKLKEYENNKILSIYVEKTLVAKWSIPKINLSSP